MKVCLVALGKIGLPLAVQCALKGHDVIGADVNAEVVDLVNQAREPFPGEADLAEHLATVIAAGRLTATTDTASAVAQSDFVVVVVPLMVDEEGIPDYRAMDAATQDIGRGLRPGTLVSYETTLPLGATRQRFAPALAAASGLVAGADFSVCHSPERVYSGRIFADLRQYPKLVGGIDDLSTSRAVEFYEAILDFNDRPDLGRRNGVWDLGSAEAAEFAKLAETTYRDVNIALANTFARTADEYGVDIYKVIESSNSQPFSHIHQPGIAVGGHCIPVYPRFYLSNDPSADVVRVGRSTNDSMPGYAVGKVADRLGGLKGKKVAILGAAYRGGVKEIAFSGVFGVVASLQEHGAVAVVEDPLYTDPELEAMGFTPHHLGESCDAAIVQSNHAEYSTLSAADLPGCGVVLDGRNSVPVAALRDSGVDVVTIGRGSD